MNYSSRVRNGPAVLLGTTSEVTTAINKQSTSMSDEPKDCDLATLLQRDGWIQSLSSKQKQREAIVLRDWSFSDQFVALCRRYELNDWAFGAEPPDFVLVGKNRVAVEVTRIVTPKKAIFDKSGCPSGGYVSTLRRSPPTAEFHQQIQSGGLPDNSLVRPHVESLLDLDLDYYALAEERLLSKVEAAKQIAPLYDHTVIVLGDELSEFNPTLDRRLPQLCAKCYSLNLPFSIEVIVINGGLGSGVVVHTISNSHEVENC